MLKLKKLFFLGSLLVVPFVHHAQIGDPCALTDPNTSDIHVCGPGEYDLTASAESGNIVWYNTSAGEAIGFGPTYTTPEIEATTDYFVAAEDSYSAFWNFNSGLQGWTNESGCDGIDEPWQFVADGGATALFAEDFSTNSTQLLVSPVLDASQATSIEFSITHRYNTETCCDHGYVAYRIDGGAWIQFPFDTNPYNVVDFMYNDPLLGACGNSPDIPLFAGDSGGYITSAGNAPVPKGSSTIELAFLFTSDASFGDEGWYIDEAEASINCQSEFVQSTAHVLPLNVGPDPLDDVSCSGESVSLSAASNTTNVDPAFDWFDDPYESSSFFTGDPFVTSVSETTTFYIEEQAEGGALSYAESFDEGLNGWTATATCSLTQNWELVEDQGRSVMKGNNPTGGNTSMLLYSPNLGVSNYENVYFGFKHRYNTETCCDHGYVVFRTDGGAWQMFVPEVNPYTIYDFMYNDPIFGGCGFSPDTTVFAGESGGYLTSAGFINTEGATSLQVGFLFTSDASFTDEGWFIDEVLLMSQEYCPSERVPVVAHVTTAPSDPVADDFVYCPGGLETIFAESTSGVADAPMLWFDAPIGGNIVAEGQSFDIVPTSDETFYVQELATSNLEWNFDTDLEGWSSVAHCGLGSKWEWIDDGGEGAMRAKQIGSGNSSMSLLSPVINTGPTQVVDISFDHRYNTETCCDHGYVLYRIDGGDWEMFVPEINTYNIYDFMYNDAYLANCDFSPDTTVYAGDSGGYLTSSGSVEMDGGTELEIAFFFSSDASFVDDGWFVGRVEVDGIAPGVDCASNRVPVNLTEVSLSEPEVSGAFLCFPGNVTLTANSQSGVEGTSFNWYNNAFGEIPDQVGSSYSNNLNATATYYVEEVYPMNNRWEFDNDEEGWTGITQCGLVENWVHDADGGVGAMRGDNPNNGNTSMLLQSPVIPLDGTLTAGISFNHRYNTETCCDHGYVVYRLDGGAWQYYAPYSNGYNVYDFMYNDPILGGCGFSPDTNVYAGDSQGYLTSYATVQTSGASGLELGFLFTSDASFGDEGWFVNWVEVNYYSAACASERVEVPVVLSHAGCTDPGACNYDPTAGCESGSCEYDSEACGNCTNQSGDGVDFMDYYDPGNWTIDTGVGNGSVDHYSGSIIIIGTDNDGTGVGNVLTQTTITAEVTGTFTFFWDYFTFDGPSFDPAYYINGVSIPLTSIDGGITQAGFVSFAANAGDVIGFGINATDGCCGQGMLEITEFTYPIIPCGCTDFNACNYDPAAVEDSGNCCYDNCIVFDMTDSFGDGWNGGYYVVTNNETGLEVATGTLQEGSADTDIFCLLPGCYSLDVIGGAFPTEVEWTLSGSDDGVLVGGITADQYFSVGGVSCYDCTDPTACNYSSAAAIDDASCCYNNCLEIEMFDSFGDGWNGNEYTITNLNSGLVVATGTLSGGSQGTAELCLVDGCYNIVVDGGSFQTEVDWSLFGADGGTISGIAPDDQNFSVGGVVCVGCTDFLACNYDPFAVVDNGTCDYGSCNCLGDFNNSGGIDTADLLMILADFGCLADCLTDMDGNDMVTTTDLLQFLGVFGTICP